MYAITFSSLWSCMSSIVFSFPVVCRCDLRLSTSRKTIPDNCRGPFREDNHRRRHRLQRIAWLPDSPYTHSVSSNYQPWMRRTDMSASSSLMGWKSTRGYWSYPAVAFPDFDAWHAVALGLCRVTYDRDTKVMNAATLVVQREDHTIGNAVRMYVVRRG